LLQECEDSDNLKRTEQAKRMLLRLLTRHKAAVEYVETSLETLVLKGMRTSGKKQDFDPTVTFRVADLLASISECLADKMSRLMAVTKVVRCLVHVMDAGVRLCQHFWRCHNGKPALNKLPKRIRFRQQYMLNLKSADLRDAWRAVQKSSANIPLEVTISYLRILLALVTDGNSSMVGKDRLRLVHNGGLVPLVGLMKAGADTTEGELACAIVLQLAKEPMLLKPLLMCGAIDPLKTMLDVCAPTAIVCGALDTLDVMAFNALRIADINGARIPEPGDDFEEEDYDEAIDEISRNPKELRKLQELVRVALSTSEMMSLLVQLAVAPVVEMQLGSLLVLHKLACGPSYHVVLDTLLAMGGRAMHAVVGRLRSKEVFVTTAARGVLAQVATRPEGREGMISAGIVTLLVALCHPTDTTGEDVGGLFVRSLSTTVTLAQQRICQTIKPKHLELAQTPGETVDTLYSSLLRLVTAAPPAPASSIKRLKAMGVVPLLLRFLVQPGNPVHVYELPRAQRYMGAIILSRFAAVQAVAQIACCIPVLEYLARLLQLNRVEHIEGVDLDQSPENIALCSLSNQAAPSALADMAGSSPPASMDRTADTLVKLHALEDVTSLMALPRAKGADYRMQLDRAEAVAKLLGTIVPIPVQECIAEATKELDESVGKAKVPPLLLRLTKESGPAILEIVSTVKSTGVLTTAFTTLAKLACTVESCLLLLEQGALAVVAKVLPQQETALSDTKGKKKEAELDTAEQQEVHGLAKMPPSLFTLLAQLARLQEGRDLMCALGLFPRAVERFLMTTRRPKQDALVRAEIALLFARMANTHTLSHGSANDLLLQPALIKILASLLDGKVCSLRGRYHATLTLATLSEDVMNAVPVVAGTSVVLERLCDLLNDFYGRATTTQPLLRQVLLALQGIARYPLGRYHQAVLRAGVREPLLKIGCDFQLEMGRSVSADGGAHSLGGVARDVYGMVDQSFGDDVEGGGDGGGGSGSGGGIIAQLKEASRKGEASLKQQTLLSASAGARASKQKLRLVPQTTSTSTAAERNQATASSTFECRHDITVEASAVRTSSAAGESRSTSFGSMRALPDRVGSIPAVRVRNAPSLGHTRPGGLQPSQSSTRSTPQSPPSARKEILFASTRGQTTEGRVQAEEVKRDPYGQPFMLDPVFAPTANRMEEEEEEEAEEEDEEMQRQPERRRRGRQPKLEGYTHSITRAGHQVKVRGVRAAYSARDAPRPMTSPVVDATELLPYSVRVYKRG
jgi:hypothetical protein